MASRPPARSEPSVLQVFIFKEGRFFGTECFAQSQLTVGRSPDVDLQLDDDIISRSHATITVTPEGVVLEDLKSSNGTYVNGEAIERCYIDGRDEVSIGIFTLKVKLLSKKKPEGRFQDETRMVARDELPRDQTEVVPPPEPPGEQTAVVPEPARAARPEPESEPPPEEEEYPLESSTVRSRREAVLEEVRALKAARSARAAQQQQPPPASEEFGATSTERLGRSRGSEPPRTAPQPDAEEPAPAPAAPKESPLGMRWFTPEPAAEPAPELDRPVSPSARELEPLAPPPPKPEPASAPVPYAPAMEEPLPPAAAAGPEDEDEDDEEERDFVEPFSLLNNLVKDNFAQPQVPTLPTPVVEVISYNQDKKVLEYGQVEVGKRHILRGTDLQLIEVTGAGACRLNFDDSISGGVILAGRQVALAEVKQGATQKVRRGRSVYSTRLARGDYANLMHEGGGTFVRFVNPPRLPEVKQFKLDPNFIKGLGGSAIAHVLVMFIWYLFSGEVVASVSEAERFAKVDLKDIEIETPKEEEQIPLDQLPPPEPKLDEVKQEKPKEEPKQAKPEKVKPVKNPPKTKGGGGGGDNQPPGAGMMAALGNLSKKAPATNIVAAVSNLDAVRVPGGKARFKVSGVVTKLPTSSVVFSRGAGVGVKADIDLLRGGKGQGGMAGIGPGALTGGATGKRSVGGVVFKAPPRNIRVQGQLSREEIAKVVAQHLREIQYCYEKNLLMNPNLSGKVIMEWTITLSGSVSIVKTSQNSMATPAVAMCISARIKEWKFPAPRGGQVIVSYPFIFNQVGF